jgi:hypothetical protein
MGFEKVQKIAETTEAEKAEGLEAVRAASKQAQATHNNQQYNLPSKSTIVNLFEDGEVVENGKLKFGEISVSSKK